MADSGDNEEELPTCPTISNACSNESRYCKVAGCRREMRHERGYFRRYTVCETHLKALQLVIDGTVQRFCQQCAKFQPIEDFTGERRSCKEQLEKHKLRRRVKLQQQRILKQQQRAQQQLEAERKAAGEPPAATIGEGRGSASSAAAPGAAVAAAVATAGDGGDDPTAPGSPPEDGGGGGGPKGAARVILPPADVSDCTTESPPPSPPRRAPRQQALSQAMVRGRRGPRASVLTEPRQRDTSPAAVAAAAAVGADAAPPSDMELDVQPVRQRGQQPRQPRAGPRGDQGRGEADQHAAADAAKGAAGADVRRPTFKRQVSASAPDRPNAAKHGGRGPSAMHGMYDDHDDYYPNQLNDLQGQPSTDAALEPPDAPPFLALPPPPPPLPPTESCPGRLQGFYPDHYPGSLTGPSAHYAFPTGAHQQQQLLLLGGGVRFDQLQQQQQHPRQLALPLGALEGGAPGNPYDGPTSIGGGGGGDGDGARLLKLPLSLQAERRAPLHRDSGGGGTAGTGGGSPMICRGPGDPSWPPRQPPPLPLPPPLPPSGDSPKRMEGRALPYGPNKAAHLAVVSQHPGRTGQLQHDGLQQQQQQQQQQQSSQRPRPPKVGFQRFLSHDMVLDGQLDSIIQTLAAEEQQQLAAAAAAATASGAAGQAPRALKAPPATAPGTAPGGRLATSTDGWLRRDASGPLPPGKWLHGSGDGTGRPEAAAAAAAAGASTCPGGPLSADALTSAHLSNPGRGSAPSSASGSLYLSGSLGPPLDGAAVAAAAAAGPPPPPPPQFAQNGGAGAAAGAVRSSAPFRPDAVASLTEYVDAWWYLGPHPATIVPPLTSPAGSPPPPRQLKPPPPPPPPPSALQQQQQPQQQYPGVLPGGGEEAALPDTQRDQQLRPEQQQQVPRGVQGLEAFHAGSGPAAANTPGGLTVTQAQPASPAVPPSMAGARGLVPLTSLGEHSGTGWLYRSLPPGAASSSGPCAAPSGGEKGAADADGASAEAAAARRPAGAHGTGRDLDGAPWGQPRASLPPPQQQDQQQQQQQQQDQPTGMEVDTDAAEDRQQPRELRDAKEAEEPGPEAPEEALRPPKAKPCSSPGGECHCEEDGRAAAAGAGAPGAQAATGHGGGIPALLQAGDAYAYADGLVQDGGVEHRTAMTISRSLGPVLDAVPTQTVGSPVPDGSASDITNSCWPPPVVADAAGLSPGSHPAPEDWLPAPGPDTSLPASAMNQAATLAAARSVSLRRRALRQRYVMQAAAAASGGLYPAGLVSGDLQLQDDPWAQGLPGPALPGYHSLHDPLHQPWPGRRDPWLGCHAGDGNAPHAMSEGEEEEHRRWQREVQHQQHQQHLQWYREQHHYWEQEQGWRLERDPPGHSEQVWLHHQQLHHQAYWYGRQHGPALQAQPPRQLRALPAGNEEVLQQLQQQTQRELADAPSSHQPPQPQRQLQQAGGRGHTAQPPPPPPSLQPQLSAHAQGTWRHPLDRGAALPQPALQRQLSCPLPGMDALRTTGPSAGSEAGASQAATSAGDGSGPLPLPLPLPLPRPGADLRLAAAPPQSLDGQQPPNPNPHQQPQQVPPPALMRRFSVKLYGMGPEQLDPAVYENLRYWFEMMDAQMYSLAIRTGCVHVTADLLVPLSYDRCRADRLAVETAVDPAPMSGAHHAAQRLISDTACGLGLLLRSDDDGGSGGGDLVSSSGAVLGLLRLLLGRNVDAFCRSPDNGHNGQGPQRMVLQLDDQVAAWTIYRSRMGCAPGPDGPLVDRSSPQSDSLELVHNSHGGDEPATGHPQDDGPLCCRPTAFGCCAPPPPPPPPPPMLPVPAVPPDHRTSQPVPPGQPAMSLVPSVALLSVAPAVVVAGEAGRALTVRLRVTRGSVTTSESPTRESASDGHAFARGSGGCGGGCSRPAAGPFPPGSRLLLRYTGRFLINCDLTELYDSQHKPPQPPKPPQGGQEPEGQDPPEVVSLTLPLPADELGPGLAFLETTCGDLLGPWLPLLVVPSGRVQVAGELRRLLAARDPTEAPDVKRFVVGLGRLLQQQYGEAGRAAAASAAPAAGPAAAVASRALSVAAAAAAARTQAGRAPGPGALWDDLEALVGSALRGCAQWHLPETAGEVCRHLAQQRAAVERPTRPA